MVLGKIWALEEKDVRIEERANNDSQSKYDILSWPRHSFFRFEKTIFDYYTLRTEDL